MSREIGLSQLHVFKLTDPDTAAYDAAIPVPWVVSIEASKTVSEFQVFADNVAEIASSRPTGATLTIEVSSDMTPKLEAQLTGKFYANGMMVGGADETKPQWGIAYETVMDNGNTRRYFYTNCTISKNEQSNETISDSITAQTYTLTANCVPIASTKQTDMVMDEDEMLEAVQEATDDGNVALAAEIQRVWDEWFTTAPVMPE